MGDTQYDQLSDTIGKMKRAAIDCWMADQSFHPTPANDMIYAKWGWMLNFYNRPDANGNGGGDGNGVKDSVAAEFEEIRVAIDGVVGRWLALPDGAECETPQTAVSSTGSILGSSVAGATAPGGADIGTPNGTVHETVVNSIEGSFTAPFLDKYYTQFSKVSHGLGEACVILEANYLAEMRMWPAARTDVAAICESAKNRWAQKADDAAQANGTLMLTVVAAVAGAVASVVTAGAGTVAAVAALGSVAAIANTAVQGIAAEAVVSGNTYGDILGSLSDALGTLNDALEAQERALDTAMSDAIGTIRGDLPSYNLDAFSLDTYTTGTGTMTLTQTHADIVSNNMARIDSALAEAYAGLGSAPSSNPTVRNASIGLGANGTHASASELYALTAQCLSLTTAEYARGHGLFDATVDDYFTSDASAAQTVARLRADEALTAELGV